MLAARFEAATAPGRAGGGDGAGSGAIGGAAFDADRSAVSGGAAPPFQADPGASTQRWGPPHVQQTCLSLHASPNVQPTLVL